MPKRSEQTRHRNDRESPLKTQRTQPKKGEPVQIPVPKISTIGAAIRKVAQPERKKAKR